MGIYPNTRRCFGAVTRTRVMCELPSVRRETQSARANECALQWAADVTFWAICPFCSVLWGADSLKISCHKSDSSWFCFSKLRVPMSTAVGASGVICQANVYAYITGSTCFYLSFPAKSRSFTSAFKVGREFSRPRTEAPSISTASADGGAGASVAGQTFFVVSASGNKHIRKPVMHQGVSVSAP